MDLASAHGLSLMQENRGFWRFLIPGVGMAPVNGFRVLITLFVVLIGPVNYVLLRRKRRLHLLLVMIPAGAALVTGSLFAYAMVNDRLASWCTGSWRCVFGDSLAQRT